MYRVCGRRSNTKLYNIYCNGSIVGTGAGTTINRAIRQFARVRGMKIGTSKSFGACGSDYNQCRKYVTNYCCGATQKCSSVNCVESSIGMLYGEEYIV